MKIERLNPCVYAEYSHVGIGQVFDTGDGIFIKTKSAAVELSSGVAVKFDDDFICKLLDATLQVSDMRGDDTETSKSYPEPNNYVVNVKR